VGTDGPQARRAALAVIRPRDGVPGEDAVVDPATEPAPTRSLCDGALAGPSAGDAGAPPPRPGGPCLEGVFSAPFIKQDSAQLKDVSD
jgi:hypothetical protein